MLLLIDLGEMARYIIVRKLIIFYSKIAKNESLINFYRSRGAFSF